MEFIPRLKWEFLIMKIWIVVICALAFALEEPEPISEQEKNDEVAQAQTRSK